MLKLRFLDYFPKAETEECDRQDWSVSDKSGLITSCSPKVVTKASLGGKKLWKLKIEECDRKNWSFSDKFGMLMPRSKTLFLEVSAHVSLKVATKGSFRSKEIWKFAILKAFLLKKKRRSVTKNIEVSLINLALLYLAQLHFFWN